MSDDDEEVADANTIEDGDSVEVQGSSSMYTLSRQGTVYMCSCPAWKNQSAPVDMRTCKHLRGYLGEEAETKRLGSLPSRAASTRSASGKSGPVNKKETAPPVLLAHKWETEHDPTGWWMSEKLDGVRAYWDGERFLSRQGNEFHAPDWFARGLPQSPLDGELWMDRKAFQRTVSIVRRQDRSDHWEKIRYVVFDAPALEEPFEARLSYVEDRVRETGSEFVRALEHERCRGLEHLRKELERIESLGGDAALFRRQDRQASIAHTERLGSKVTGSTTSRSFRTSHAKVNESGNTEPHPSLGEQIHRRHAPPGALQHRPARRALFAHQLRQHGDLSGRHLAKERHRAQRQCPLDRPDGIDVGEQLPGRTVAVHAAPRMRAVSSAARSALGRGAAAAVGPRPISAAWNAATAATASLPCPSSCPTKPS